MSAEKKDRVVCTMFALLLAGGLLLCFFMPKNRYSESERRMLSTMPALSAENVWRGRFMADFEGYAADTFPFRATFRRIKALTALHIFSRQDNNGLYVWDGFISSMEYPMNEASLAHAAGRFRAICEKHLTQENKVYFSVIPDKNCFLAKESGHLSIDYEKFDALTSFGDIFAYDPFDSVKNKASESRGILIDASENDPLTYFTFYKESRDGSFGSFKGHHFFLMDGKMYLARYHDRSEDMVSAVELSEETSSCFIETVTPFLER